MTNDTVTLWTQEQQARLIESLQAWVVSVQNFSQLFITLIEQHAKDHEINVESEEE